MYRKYDHRRKKGFLQYIDINMVNPHTYVAYINQKMKTPIGNISLSCFL